MFVKIYLSFLIQVKEDGEHFELLQESELMAILVQTLLMRWNRQICKHHCVIADVQTDDHSV